MRFSPVTLFLFALTPLVFAQTTERHYLSGRGKDDAVAWRFQCTSGANSGVWTNVPVPSHWDVHGFGTLSYRRDSTNAWDERGLYQHEFTIPNGWAGRRVFLVFEGVMTDTHARVNGETVGPAHQGGFYRFKYEITRLLKPAHTNLLEVEVAKRSANESVNRAERLADYWIFGGIYRPVYLEAVPQSFIERVAIDARHDGTFSMDVFLSGGQEGDRIDAQILSLDGTAAGELFGIPAVLTNARSRKTTLQTRIHSPRTWNAETPHLYSVDVLLRRGDQVVHRYRQRFGFRTFEVRDGDGLYVNDRRVVLKGVNRHSFWPDSGRCLSEAVHRLDIETIKDMNMNAVRMSHYPPDVEFLDLCDELGLYVLNELAGWHNHYDTQVGSRLVEEMVARDVNHPSILFWNNGNEGGFNTDLDPLFAEFDIQKRRVLHPWVSFNGLCTAHYLAFDKAQIAASGQSVYYHDNQELVATNDHTKYIYMPTEMMHGLYDGGSGAALEDYWTMMSASPLLGGGFLWVLADDAVKRPGTGELDPAGNQAPDGIVGPYRQREGSFFTIKELWSPIRITRNGDRQFTVENQFSFLNANECRFTWQARKLADPAVGLSGYITVYENVVEVPSIPPGGKGAIRLPLELLSMSYDAISIRADDPSGRELWTWVWPMDGAGDLGRRINAPAEQRVTAAQTDEHVEIRSGEVVIRIDRKTGLLAHVSKAGEKFSLRNGPRMEDANMALTSLRAEQDGPDHIVSARYNGSLKSVFWRIHGSGWVRCEYRYSASGTNTYLGVIFDYPENLVTGKRWLGNGPFRVWKNRLAGGTLNVWETQYNDTITGYRDWIYPEFKGCFAGVRWMQLETREGLVTIVPEEVPFVQVLAPDQPPDALVGKTKVTLPNAGLGLLHGIPAIGTKFKDATMSGPQSQPYVGNNEYSGAVSFYFGALPESSSTR